MPDTRKFEFELDSSEATHATEVYVAGSFNNWLRADAGSIHPTVEDVDRYRLSRPEPSSVWKREVELSPGTYEFKFVVGGNYWIHWYESSGYAKGSDAPGGSNFRIEIGP